MSLLQISKRLLWDEAEKLSPTTRVSAHFYSFYPAPAECALPRDALVLG
jgi:hypothetical protein